MKTKTKAVARKNTRGRKSNRLQKPSDLVTPPSKLNGKATVAVEPRHLLPSHAHDERSMAALKPSRSVTPLCLELQALQRQRAIYIKSRIMVANRLQAIVAGTIGYHSGMSEKERQRTFTQAGKLIKQIRDDEVKSPLHGLVMAHVVGIDEFLSMQKGLEKSMLQIARQLPAACWVEQPEQRGFGLLFLAIVIGETGDLFNYANPAKVWRRLGCAPHTFNGHTLMGATWRSGKYGKLPASEWEELGYSPRRRSIAYLIGEGIVKQNTVVGDETGHVTDCLHVPGPYRRRYDETKELIKQNHPDYSDLRCHRHGMLLATKLLLKNLWIEWNKAG